MTDRGGDNPVPRRHRRRAATAPRRPGWRRWVGLAVAGVAVGALVAGVVVVNLVGLRRPCADGRTTLTVATGSGLYAALDQLARAFAASQRGGCVAVNLVRAESADVAATLRPGWSGATRPDVWIPDSWLWVRVGAAPPGAGPAPPGPPAHHPPPPAGLPGPPPGAGRA